MKYLGKINFDGRPEYDADGLITSAEVDTVSGSLQTNINGKSDTGHTHDDRYYTESEIDAMGKGLSWEVISTDTSAVKDHGYLINASSGNVTLTLPSTPIEVIPAPVCIVFVIRINAFADADGAM